MEPNARAVAIVCCLGFLFAVGCVSEPPVTYEARVGFAELPELHRKGIEATLLRMFGTPHNPLLRMPQLPDESSEEGADEETDIDSTPTMPAVQYLAQVDAHRLQRGARIYNLRCAGCHGVSGDGNGAAAEFLQPKPRDYRNGVFKFTSTPYGMKPARQDLVRVIRRGAKGTSMPAFPWMSREDLELVIDYVMMLSTRGEVESYVVGMSEDYEPDESLELFEYVDALDMVQTAWREAAQEIVLPVTARPSNAVESASLGRELFRTQGCSKCHGEDGTGQTEWLSHEFISSQEALPESQRAEINYDAWGNPAPAADITARLLHGGRRPIDLYRRIATGINGTPMPAFAATFADDPDKIWHLVHYVLHIIEGGEPRMDAKPLTPPPDSESVPDGDVGEASATAA